MGKLPDGSVESHGSCHGSDTMTTRQYPSKTVSIKLSAVGFKPSVAAAKSPGGFDSHPLPFFLLFQRNSLRGRSRTCWLARRRRHAFGTKVPIEGHSRTFCPTTYKRLTRFRSNSQRRCSMLLRARILRPTILDVRELCLIECWPPEESQNTSMDNHSNFSRS